MPCAYISLGLKKSSFVNHQPSSQMFDAGSINFISCSSCFAQKNCNFIHAVNISLHNSRGKYKVKDAIYILDESMKIRPTSLLLSSLIISSGSRLLSCYNTVPSHQMFLYSSGFSSMKGRKYAFQKRDGFGIN